ncbi:MAG: radical SAM protein [Candidatus Omnitrophica bacterium]|nr:radical SAM protein [Candidatus Omnitrophota bacterium]
MEIELKETFPVLNKTTAFVPCKDYAILMDLCSGAHLPLDPRYAFLISLCNGRFSKNQIFDLSQTLDNGRKISKDSLEGFLKESSKNYLHLRNTPLREPIQLPDPVIFAKQAYMPSSNPWDTGIPYDRPVEFDLYLTKRCNMNCCYCFVESGPKQAKNELSYKEFIRVLEEASALGVLRCTITGGEPTLNKNFIELITRCVSLRMHAALATNGTSLSCRILSKLKDAGLGSIQISLDTFKPDVFKQMAKTTFTCDTVIKSVKETLRCGIPLSIKAVLTKNNINSVDKFIDRCVDLGVKDIRLRNFEPSLKGRGGSSYFITENDLENLKAFVELKRRLFGQEIKISLILTGEKWEPGRFRCCRHALSGMGILANGDVTVCDRFGHDKRMVIGNVRKQPLSKIWKSEKHLNITRPAKIKASGACASCEDFDRCRTGCFLYSLYSYGDIYAPDPRCFRAISGGENKNPLFADKIILNGEHLFCINN